MKLVCQSGNISLYLKVKPFYLEAFKTSHSKSKQHERKGNFYHIIFLEIYKGFNLLQNVLRTGKV